MPLTPSEADAFLAHYRAQDQLLVEAGMPPTSPWWDLQIERAFRSGKNTHIFQCGRRGGKSSVLSPRVGTAWLTAGKWYVPPGDLAVVGIASIDRQEAAKRLRMIEQVIDVLGLRHKPLGREGMGIYLPEYEAAFQVFTASVGGVSGPTCIAFFGDEMAKWKDSTEGVNPSREVFASARPTMATQPHAPQFWVSSAWDTTNFHHELMERGETEAQTVHSAPTWVANPTITEEQTHILEPDERVWMREYANIPQEGLVADWFGGALDVALEYDAPPELMQGIDYLVAIDAAFLKDRFGWAVIGSRVQGKDARGMPFRETWLQEAGAWGPEELGPIDGRPTRAAEMLAERVCAKYRFGKDGPFRIFGDQHEGQSFRDVCRHQGLTLEVVPWTAGSGTGKRRKKGSAKETSAPWQGLSKTERFKSVRLAFADGTFKLLLGGMPERDAESLRLEFKRVYSDLLANDHERIQVPRTDQGHGDQVSAVVLAGSIALAMWPKEEARKPPPQTEMAKHKAKLAAEIRKKHQKAWNDSPRSMMAKVMGR